MSMLFDTNTEKMPEVLSEIESLNVDIPANRLRVREELEKRINDLINADEMAKKEIDETCDNLDLLDDPNSLLQTNSSNLDILAIAKQKQSIQEEMKKFKEARDALFLKEITPNFYYYKRWIWMIFPWACMSEKKSNSFSEAMQNCFLSSTYYIGANEDSILRKSK